MALEDRAPDCATPRATTIAGIVAAAVMAGEMSINSGDVPDDVERRIEEVSPNAFDRDIEEGFRVAGLMISARARASVRTPSHAALSGAEAALALAEDALKGECATSPAGEDAFAALASIRDTLRAGLAPLHAAEGSGPAGA